MERIAPGHHLYPGPDGRWRHHGPDGRFTRIQGPAEALDAVRRRAYAGLVPADGGPAAAALRERGVLVPPDERAELGAPWHVHIEGENPVAEAVAALLRPVAEVSAGPVDEEAVRAADALVSCAGWLPDGRWSRVGAWCGRYGTAWHRAYVEGVRTVAGPLALPGGAGTGYADVRGRLLAAADLPDELAAFWAYLDEERELPPVPWPSAAGSALVAGLVVADLTRWRETGEPAARDTQFVVDTRSLLVTCHLVLPLPVTARDAGPEVAV